MHVEPDTIADTYTPDYYGSASSKFIAGIERVLALSTAVRARKILRIWRKANQTENHPAVLDIGCGRGHLLRAFQKLGAITLGLERQEFPIDEKTDDSVRIGSIFDPEYAKRQFDIIILWHVLEHLDKHDALLRDFASRLNQDGFLIIAVPDFSSLQQTLFSKYWFHLDLPRHLVHFDRDWLERNLSKNGYEIEFKSSTDLLQNTFGFIQSAMNFTFRDQRNAFYNLLKHGHYLRGKSILPSVFWTLVSFIFLPFALLEGVIGAISGRGATIQIAARLTGSR
jgi:SAM-dependent methyltransferase